MQGFVDLDHQDPVQEGILIKLLRVVLNRAFHLLENPSCPSVLPVSPFFPDHIPLIPPIGGMDFLINIRNEMELAMENISSIAITEGRPPSEREEEIFYKLLEVNCLIDDLTNLPSFKSESSAERRPEHPPLGRAYFMKELRESFGSFILHLEALLRSEEKSDFVEPAKELLKALQLEAESLWPPEIEWIKEWFKRIMQTSIIQEIYKSIPKEGELTQALQHSIQSTLEIMNVLDSNELEGEPQNINALKSFSHVLDYFRICFPQIDFSLIEPESQINFKNHLWEFKKGLAVLLDYITGMLMAVFKEKGNRNSIKCSLEANDSSVIVHFVFCLGEMDDLEMKKMLFLFADSIMPALKNSSLQSFKEMNGPFTLSLYIPKMH